MAIVVLAMVAPILFVFIIGIRISSPGPAFYLQERAGRGGKPFRLFKLRTMTNRPERTPDREIHHGDAEVTAIGAFLRRFKFDELPQLGNVLKGEMSIVGPRPGLLTQAAVLDESGRLRLLVRPGMTGLAQVSGNIHISWPERWQFDAEYVRNLSFGLDCRIVRRTVGVVLLGEARYVSKRLSTGDTA